MGAKPFRTTVIETPFGHMLVDDEPAKALSTIIEAWALHEVLKAQEENDEHMD